MAHKRSKPMHGKSDECAACEGHGTCSECQGLGYHVCGFCSGTGEAEGGVCPACRGRGEHECRGCAATGECSSCNGTGRPARRGRSLDLP